MADITAEDRERVHLLHMVSGSRGGFKQMSLAQLVRLQELVGKKDYGHSKKASRSKAKLLAKINVRIYELTEGRGIWGGDAPR